MYIMMDTNERMYSQNILFEDDRYKEIWKEIRQQDPIILKSTTQIYGHYDNE